MRILAFCLFFVLGANGLQAQITRNEHCAAPLFDSEHCDMVKTFDSCTLVALKAWHTISNVWVHKYDAQGHLLWAKKYFSSSSDEVLDITLLPFPNGNFALHVLLAGCDYVVPNILAVIDANGVLIWQNLNVPVGGGLDLVPAENGAFYAVKSQNNINFAKFDQNGTILETGTSIYPIMGVYTNDGVVVLRDNTFSKVANGNIFIYSWPPDKPIRILDTYPNGDIGIFDNEQITRLSTDLQWISTVDFNEDFQHAALDEVGFMTTVAVDSFLFLQRYNDNAELTQILDLGKHLSNSKFFIRNNVFQLAATNALPDMSKSLWFATDTTAASGQWKNNHDLRIVGVQFSGVPTATYLLNAEYKVNYSDVFVVVENIGTELIEGFNLKYRASSCAVLCGTDVLFGGSSTASLLPGESKVVYMGNVAASCVSSDVTYFCIWASEIDQLRDDDQSNNSYCTYIPDIVPVREASLLSVKTYPNPASNILKVSVPDYVQIGHYRIYDASGRLVNNGGYNGQFIDIQSVEPGTYLLEMTLNNQTTAIATFVKL